MMRELISKNIEKKWTFIEISEKEIEIEREKEKFWIRQWVPVLITFVNLTRNRRMTWPSKMAARQIG